MFVYGTLMEGYRNYKKYLEGHVISARGAYVYGKMYHLDNEDCPAIVEGDCKVYGQVLEVEDDKDNTIQKAVDDLEHYFAGCDEMMYDRVMKSVYYEDGSSEELGVYVFINKNYLDNSHITDVDSGDWRVYLGDS